jgi:hypothetical protein
MGSFSHGRVVATALITASAVWTSIACAAPLHIAGISVVPHGPTVAIWALRPPVGLEPALEGRSLPLRGPGSLSGRGNGGGPLPPDWMSAAFRLLEANSAALRCARGQRVANG